MIKPLLISMIMFFVYSTKAQAVSAEVYLHAVEQMYDLGLEESFIELAEINFDEADRDTILRLNILSFIKPVSISGPSPIAVEKCKAFMALHEKELQNMERLYGVSKEVVTALTWTETRLGTYLGNRSVLHVYFSLMQADHPESIDIMIAMAKSLLNTPTLDPEVEQKIRDRAASKAKWAGEQMLALSQIYKKQMIDVNALFGSFAGAFGMVQFIPSSYVSWAVSSAQNRFPNLFAFEDASLSVGNYLNVHGWVVDDPESHVAALFAYNHSMAYVQGILELAELL